MSSAQEKPLIRTVATFRDETSSMAEAFALYRLVRDLCARHGLPDWGEMRFTLECEFQAVGALEPDAVAGLKEMMNDLDLALTVREEEF